MTFQRACALDEIPEGAVLSIDLGTAELYALARTDQGFFAIRDRCSHADVPLSEGFLEGCTLECSAHGARFDLRSGVPLDPPAVVPVPTYPVRVEGAEVFIDPDNPISQQEH